MSAPASAPSQPSAPAAASPSSALLNYCLFLRNFCSFHGEFSFSRCFSALDGLASSLPRDWLQPLATLVSCESSYYQLDYLQSSTSCSNLVSAYAGCSAAIRRLAQEVWARVSPVDVEDFLLEEPAVLDGLAILLHYAQLINLRLVLIPLFQGLRGRKKAPAYFELIILTNKLASKYSLQGISNAIRENAARLTPPLPATLSASPHLFGLWRHSLFELSLLELLFKSELYTQRGKFKDATINAFFTKQKLGEWNSSIASAASKGKFPIQFPAIHGWIAEFLASITCKLTLCFQSVLKQKSTEIATLDSLRDREKDRENSAGPPLPPNLFELKCSKLPVDFPYVLERFVKRANATDIAVLLETAENQESLGYQAEDAMSEAPSPSATSGGFSVLFHSSPVFAFSSSCFSLVRSRHDQLAGGEIFFEAAAPTNSSASHCFYIARIDGRLFLALICPALKKRQDIVLSELQQILDRLRHLQMFQQLGQQKKK